MRSAAVLSFCLILMLLGGCQTTDRIFDNAKTSAFPAPAEPQSSSAGPNIADIPAQPDQQGSMTLVRAYQSARGRSCALLRDSQKTWLACRAGGGWEVRPALMTADAVFGDAP